jgi:hypothetical protein
MAKLLKYVFVESKRDKGDFYWAFTESDYANQKDTIRATKEVRKTITLETALKIRTLLDEKKHKELILLIKWELEDVLHWEKDNENEQAT